MPYGFSPAPEDGHRKPVFSVLSALVEKYLHLDTRAIMLTVDS